MALTLPAEFVAYFDNSLKTLDHNQFMLLEAEQHISLASSSPESYYQLHFLQQLQKFLHAHWLIVIVNKQTDT